MNQNKMPLRKINNLKKSIVINPINQEEQIIYEKPLKHVNTLKKTVLPTIKEKPIEPEKIEFDSIPLKKISNMVKTTKLCYEEKEPEQKIEFDNIPLKKISNLVKTVVKDKIEQTEEIKFDTKPLKKINYLIKSIQPNETIINEPITNFTIIEPKNKINIDDIKYINDINSDDELDIKIN